MKSCISLRSFRSRAPSGSSSRRTCGLLTSARARATRCCWPPESWRGLRRSMPESCDELEHLHDALPDVGLADAAAAEAEGDVLEYVQVREERVALEDGVDVTPVRREIGDVAVAEVDRAVARLLEAADHAERRRLPAARGTEEREEAPARHLEREVVDRDDLVEALRDALEADVRCGRLAPRRRRRLYALLDGHPGQSIFAITCLICV